MAKGTEKFLKPDDPIFSSGPSTFVPVSRPSTRNSPSDSTGTEQLLGDVMKAQETKSEELKAKQLRLLEHLRAQRSQSEMPSGPENKNDLEQ